MSNDDEDLLEQLFAERARILAEYPQLKPLQREIDQVLGAAGQSPKERLGRLFEMLSGVLNEEMVPELQKLKSRLDGLCEVRPDRRVRKKD